MVTQNVRLHPSVGSSHLASASWMSIPGGSDPLRPGSLGPDTALWRALLVGLVFELVGLCPPCALEEYEAELDGWAFDDARCGLTWRWSTSAGCARSCFAHASRSACFSWFCIDCTDAAHTGVSKGGLYRDVFDERGMVS